MENNSLDMERTKVAIVGMGTVGSGVARLLLDHGDRTARHAGRTLWLEQVVVRDIHKKRDADLPTGLISDDLEKITGDPEIKVVAQLIGGLEPAKTIMLRLLESGKDVVTANKALLAEHGPELFDRARDLGRTIAFEASVAGGIPIVANIGQCLSANQVTSIRAILNGTSNYILSQMEAAGLSFENGVADAKEKGFAEADPRMDVDGTDATQKLAILAHLAFGARIHWSEIPRTGIEGVSQQDIHFAESLGYRIRLLAIAQMNQSALELHVSPTLIRIGQPLGEVRGPYNAVSVVGDAVGRVFFHGQGAGRMPTASAVVADMIDTAVGRTQLTFRNLELWSDQQAPVAILDPSMASSRYFTRFMIQDQPGMLAKIAGIFGNNGISISSVIQHEPQMSKDDLVPLVIMTYNATAAAARQSLQEIEKLDSVQPGSLFLRVLDTSSL
ncbi:homoserine dehydrogenase [Pirellulaceae bacterium]|jgi:homoserine dehydrogenase|nr:homoserine dehydrogenase [Pirellulaceae bacterium]